MNNHMPSYEELLIINSQLGEHCNELEALPYKQTDFITRIIALFKVLLYRVFLKKLLKTKNTRFNQLEPEFSFSFDLFFP